MAYILGCDHAGLNLARDIEETLKRLQIDDVLTFIPQSGKVDYPDYARLVCKEVQKSVDNIGILVCGSGIGMSICANKFEGIRAALCVNEYMAKYARAHNNANVLCLGERVVGTGLAIHILEVFINTEFEGERHKIRVEKIAQLEKE